LRFLNFETSKRNKRSVRGAKFINIIKKTITYTIICSFYGKYILFIKCTIQFTSILMSIYVRLITEAELLITNVNLLDIKHALQYTSEKCITIFHEHDSAHRF